MNYVIRPVEPAEWKQSRDLRLAALQDPVAEVAFARSFAEESALADEVWQQRASGAGSQQFVAVEDVPAVAGSHEGAWVGMAVVGTLQDGRLHLGGVYLRPEARGTGVADRLFEAAITWAWEHGDRLFLWVHEKNPRAEAFYRRTGFERTGQTMRYPLDLSATEYEMVLIRK